MSGIPPPRRAYGLPSNPRQGPSLKHTKSQPDLARRSHESPVAEPLPTSYSRPSSRAREAPARFPSRSATRAVKFSDASSSPARSDSALPSIGRSLRSTNNQTRGSGPSSRPSLDETTIPPHLIQENTPPALNQVEDPNDEPLWKKMATMLTVNVSKALAATIEEGDGEATPFGQESRLTKAMKSYHLAQARDHSDLPDWLFTETERRRKPVLQRQARDAPPADNLAQQSSAFLPTHRAIHSQGSVRAQENRERTSQDSSHKGGTKERLRALRERGRHIEKSASTSQLPPSAYREQPFGRPVALPSTARPLVQR